MDQSCSSHHQPEMVKTHGFPSRDVPWAPLASWHRPSRPRCIYRWGTPRNTALAPQWQQWTGFLEKIETGNQRFSHEIWWLSHKIWWFSNEIWCFPMKYGVFPWNMVFSNDIWCFPSEIWWFSHEIWCFPLKPIHWHQHWGLAATLNPTAKHDGS